jgi:hypothetical protein
LVTFTNLLGFFKHLFWCAPIGFFILFQCNSFRSNCLHHTVSGVWTRNHSVVSPLSTTRPLLLAKKFTVLLRTVF